jgi:outer membrane lipoprotein-sorting protein
MIGYALAVGIDPAPYIDYINNLTTVEAQFLQENPDGSLDEGVFYLSRPGLMRLDYAPPNPLQIIARDQYLIHYNRDTREANYLALSDTPAAVLLQPKIMLGNELKVEKAIAEKGLVRIRLRHIYSEGYIEMVFAPLPIIELKQWMVVDASGNQTRVTLQGAHTGKVFAEGLFAYPK